MLVLDEIDFLIRSRETALLEQIFEWPHLYQSKLIVIGIANTLDLPDRELANLAKKKSTIRICCGWLWVVVGGCVAFWGFLVFLCLTEFHRSAGSSHIDVIFCLFALHAYTR